MNAINLRDSQSWQTALSRTLTSVQSWLPEGQTLPDDLWRHRHRGILILLWIQAAGLIVMAMFAGYGPIHGIGDSLPIMLAAAAAQWAPLGRRWRACIASLGLITVSAMVVHLSHGNTESHFHFFVMVPIIVLYQDWLPFLLAIGEVVLHHGVMGVIAPRSVYDHPDAWVHPWKWAAIHGAFVLAAAAASIIIWRQGERAHARAELILRSVGEGMFGVDTAGLITFVNPAAAQMLGWKAADLINRMGHVVLDPATAGERSWLHPGFSGSAVPSGDPAPLANDTMFRRRDGSSFPAAVVSVPVREHGTIVGAVVTFTDVTERQRIEAEIRGLNADLERRVAERTADLAAANQELAARAQALRQSEGRLQAILDYSPAVITVKNTDGLYTLVNCEFERRLQRSSSDVLGQTAQAFLPAVTADAMRAVDQTVLQRGEPLTEETSLRLADGEHTYLATTFPLVDEEGTSYAVCTIATDITDRKRAEDERQQLQGLLDAIVEHIPNMLFVKDAQELRFVRLNRAGEALLGLPRETLLGKNDYDFFPADQADYFTSKDREVLDSHRLLDIAEEPLQTGEQGLRLLHTTKVPILDDAGKPQYLLGISEDITERKQAEAAIQQARDDAEQANRAKSEFLSRMSHELRTPLNAILGFGQLLEQDSTTAEQQESVGFILAAGRHLLELINEVLDISRIEAGRLSLSPEPVQVTEVVSEVVSLIQPLADQRDITLVVDRGEEGCHVLADRQRLKQVLLNLLSNAVKYNHDGGRVTISTMQIEQRGRITVQDTGPGIAAEHLPKLFVPFERLNADATGVEGTGLGLTLSKRLVEAMQGTMGVSSSAGAGSSFWVELALATDPVALHAQAVARDGVETIVTGGQSRTVLYIEDNLSNYRLIERVLVQRPDVGLVPAMQGQVGLDLARQHHPAAILLDLHLPDIPGEQVLAQLHNAPGTAHIPVIIVSADATPRQVDRLRTAGAYAYLTKPLDIHAFLTVLDAAMEAA